MRTRLLALLAAGSLLSGCAGVDCGADSLPCVLGAGALVALVAVASEDGSTTAPLGGE